MLDSFPFGGGLDVELLDHQARMCGVNPCDWQGLVKLASIGAAALAWRESPVEDWHVAEDGISQGEMMRLNAAATRTVYDLFRARIPLRRALWGAGRRSEDAASIFAAVHDVLANAHRLIPDGCALGDLAPGPDAWEEFDWHVHKSCQRWTLLSAVHGLRPVLVLLACHAVGHVRKWWLLPDWAARVEEFIRRLDFPETWEEEQDIADYIRQQRLPCDVADRLTLRRRLLEGPDLLSAAAAHYCLQAGLGILRPSEYGWLVCSRQGMPAECRLLAVPPASRGRPRVL